MKIIALFLITFAGFGFSLVSAVEQDFMIELEFSLDNGKTFVSDPPVLDKPGKFVVRTRLFCNLNGRSAYMPQLSSPVDFASANRGLQKWSKHARYYQAMAKSWYNADAKYFDVVVDTGPRAAGVMGRQNSWQGGKLPNKPLPACEALPVGENVFLMTVAVRVLKERHVTQKRFAVIHKNGAEGSEVAGKNTSDETRSPVVFVDLRGDDKNPGSQQAPVRTVGHALTRVSVGGMVRIGPGVYREGELVVKQGGTSSVPLTIEGAGAKVTRILGSVEVHDWKKHSSGVWKKDKFENNTQQVFCDGKHLQQIGARTPWNAKKLWANTVCLAPVGKDLADLKPGSFYHDGEQQVLYVMLADQSNPNKHCMEASVESGILRGGESSHVMVKKLTVGHTNDTHKGGRSSVLSLGKSHWTVEDCIIEYGDFCCVNASGQYHTLRRCIIRYGGDVGIESVNTDSAHGWKFYEEAPSEHLLIEDCEISYNNYRNFYASWHAGGTKFIPGSRGITIRGCKVIHNNGPGLWLDHPLGENTLENNLVANNKEGIFYEIASPQDHLKFGARIVNNTVKDNRKQGIYVSASSSVVVERNVMDNNWVNLVLHGMPRGSFHLKNNTVRNNWIGPAKHAQLIIFVGEGSGGNLIDGNFYHSVNNSHVMIGLVKGKGYNVNHQNLDSVRASLGYEKKGALGKPSWLKETK